MNIPPGSALSSPCAHITIQSTGETAYSHGGELGRLIFGTYHFVSIDARSNNMYHAIIQAADLFIRKDTENYENYWVVSIKIIHKNNGKLERREY